jgi:threonine dehydratase
LDQVSQLVDVSQEECPLDAIVIPVGGGGLLSGCTIYCKAKWPHLLVIGAEPLNMNDAARSLENGCLECNESGATTIADGLRTQLGPNTWPIVRDLVDKIVTVSEEDIISATALVWSRMKIQIEPSAGVGVACAMSDEFRSFISAKKSLDGSRPARVGVVLCGGNVDMKSLCPLLVEAKPYPTGCRSL